MIHLVPEGGLCNRMRSIASVLLLANQVGQSLTVHWRRTDDMNCAYHDLFDTAGLPFEVRESNAAGWQAGFFKIFTYSSEVLMKIIGAPVLDSKDSAALVNQDEKLRAWASRPNPRVRTHSKLLEDADLFAPFKPAKQLADVIERYASRLSRAVGVHIRRGDNLKSSQISPTNLFIDLMRAELMACPGTQFFVATDSPETFSVLRGEFGHAVFEYEKTSLDRSDPQAIRDAVIDLYCLASCRKLIGSYWSSFSDTAWEIKGIDHVIVREQAMETSGQVK